MGKRVQRTSLHRTPFKNLEIKNFDHKIIFIFLSTKRRQIKFLIIWMLRVILFIRKTNIIFTLQIALRQFFNNFSAKIKFGRLLILSRSIMFFVFYYYSCQNQSLLIMIKTKLKKYTVLFLLRKYNTLIYTLTTWLKSIESVTRNYIHVRI